MTRAFERKIAGYLSVGHAIAVTSCTTGLELALRALNIGPGDEVIVPDYTYPATAAVVNIVGAVAVIVDIDPSTLLIDYDAMETAITTNTKAAIPVSLFGNPLDWDRLNNLKKKHGIFLVEDAACAIGSSYKGVMTGADADISVFSHHPRKVITTGEGGTITTPSAEWAEWMHSYKHFGIEAENCRLSTKFVRIGTNYKLSNVLAAIGLAQMENVDELMTERQRLAKHYDELLSNIPGVVIPNITSGGKHSYQTFCILIEERNRIMTALQNRGIEAQIGTYALHLQQAFNNNPLCRIHGKMVGSRYAYERVLALPIYHGMTSGEQEEVMEILIEEIHK